MENDLFLNAAVAPPMPAWTPLASAMEVQIQAHQSADCFFDWDKSTEQSLQFDSALSSMVSSPEASNSNDSFVIRELIGKLGSIGNSGEISPHTQQLLAPSYSSNSTNTSCYSTPLNSPPKLNLPAVDETTPLRSCLTDLSADPGFAERAARFSCFGSRSFNGRTSQFGNVSRNGNPYALNADPLVGNGKLPCVSSSTSASASASIKAVGSTQRPPWQVANSQDQSAVSDADPNGDAGLKAATESGSRKRKAALKGKAKETPPTPATKACEGKEEAKAKRIKASEGNNKGDENECAKAEEEDVKQNKSNNSKPPEPPKDYIHVRARRGQATDSHSLAERVRREKISERMKLLQDLVPGCNKVTGKALMLDEIINYVQSLQRQVEFLSMKFASVNTRLDFNADSLISKDMLQQNSSLPHHMFPLDSSASAFFGHQPHQNPALHSNLSTGANNHSSVGHPFIHLPPPQHFTANLPQTFYEGDLQTIVQMGFWQNQNPDPALQSQTHSSHGSNQVPHMKAEL